MIQWANTVSFVLENILSISQIFLSAVLIIVTGIYTIFTKQQVSEMVKDREVRNQPKVRPTISSMDNINYAFAVENTGNGAAYDFSAKWWCRDEENAVEWQTPFLSPGERHTFPLPTESGRTPHGHLLEKFDEDDVIHFEATFSDLIGNKYDPEKTEEETIIEINIRDCVVPGAEASMLSSPNYGQNIVSELEDINKNLKK
uniref:Uncharacterized protein n=1 Tax=Haloferax lucentense (strain DSM 14919 / JCM 9276 / NCIMB 13854 / Aa 2.2) TaxID=1230452 RepID=D3JVD5_HALL2|nr:hypothetical protein [Haloferax lucentense]ADB79734.1 unknown [Haloferax lucentense DSM 14919]